jgi:hypothetical protein
MPEQKAKITSPKNGIAELARRLSQAGIGGRGRRSSLVRWLNVHRDPFAALLAEQEPSWTDVATALAAMGVCDGAGKPPSGERVRKAWWAVRRAKAMAAVKKRDTALPPLASDQLAPSVRAAAGAASVSAGAPITAGITQEAVITPTPDMHLRPKFELRPARPRTDLSRIGAEPASDNILTAAETSAIEVSAPGAVETDHVADQLRQLEQSMGAKKVPMPRVL